MTHCRNVHDITIECVNNIIISVSGGKPGPRFLREREIARKVAVLRRSRSRSPRSETEGASSTAPTPMAQPPSVDVTDEPPKKKSKKDDEGNAQLMEMGFVNIEDNKRALNIAYGDVWVAVQILSADRL